MTAAVEVPGFVSNLLSYLPVAVVGVAQSALAGAVNAIVFGSLFRLGAAGIVAGAVLVIGGDAFVATLAFVTFTTQALQLHYVEFGASATRAPSDR